MNEQVDNQIVSLQFDNKNFEKNTKTSMKTLDKLKEKLNFKGAAKGLQDIEDASTKVRFETLANSIDTVKNKFSALDIMGVTALANLTNSAVNYGKRIVSSLIIDPVSTGFSEYETKIGAIQTILANTSSKGTKLEDVTKVLDELNTYADKTIYNFAEMTRNIGTFTAAGVDLKVSASAIQGISNLAAVSGSTSQQASTAMYQLSQAISSGTVRLQDWNSVVNAGMGGEKFQNALIATAREMVRTTGTYAYNVDELIMKNGSFRESLREGWLTADVLTQTLKKFTVEGAKEYGQTMMNAGEWTQATADALISMAQEMEDAATKVKTFSQLWDTLKESAQSGWAQTWEILVGDFEEAKATLTKISDLIGGIINASAEARNNLLQGWKDAGGRSDLVDSLFNIINGVISIIKPIKEAFREIFPPVTVEQLVGFTKGLKALTEKLILGESASNKLKSTFKGLFSVLDIIFTIVKKVASGVKTLLSNFKGLGSGVLKVTGSLGDWLNRLRESVHETDIFGKAIDKITSFLQKAIDKIKEFTSSIKSKFKTPGFEEFLNVMKVIWNFIQKICGKIVELGSKIGSALATAFRSGDIKAGLDLFNGGVLTAILFGLKKFINNISESFENVGGFLENIKGVLGEVRGALKAWQTDLKANALLKLAIAIGILAASILLIAAIDPKKMGSSLSAITVLFIDLMGAMAVFNKIGGGPKGAIKGIAFMLAMSVAVLILSSALKKVANLDQEEIKTGLIGIAGLTAIVVAFAKIMSKNSGKIAKGSTSLVIFAFSIKILASVCKELASLSWNDLKKGLLGVGVLMGEVAVFLALAKMDKKAFKTALGIVALSVAIKILASACKDFASLNVDELKRGLLGIGALLLEISIFTQLTDKTKIMSTGIALIAIGAAMKIFASAVKDLASLSWDEIGRGIIGIAGALFSVSLALNLMPKNMISMGVGLVIISSAMKILASALKDFSEIGRGLAVLGGSIAILAIGLNTMKGTLGASAALLVATSSLAMLALVLKSLGSMSWESIGRGLVSLAGALTIIGVAGLVLKPLIPTILSLSAALALFGLACAAIGAGVALFAAGLGALATMTAASATAIVAALTIIITGIANLIPVIIMKIGEGIVELCRVIGNSTVAIGEALTAVVLTLVDVLVKCTPVLADGALKLLVGLLEALVAYTPQIVDSLFAFLIGVLEGVARNLPALIQAVVDIFMSLFSGVIDVLSNIDPETFIQGVASVGLLAGIMAALSAVAALVPGAMIGVLGMGTVIAELALVLAAIGALSQIPGLNWLIGEGGVLLENIGTAIGKFIGGLIGGVAEGASAALPQIGASLSAFMTNVTPFITGVKMVDESVLAGAGILAASIALLTAADLINSIAGFISGGSSFAQMGSDLSSFMTNAMPFILGAKLIDPDTMSGVKSLVEVLLLLTSAKILDGLTSWFSGGVSLADFGKELASFGPYMAAYAESVAGIDSETVVASANAAKALSEMASNLPNSGGVVGWFAGENDLDTFGTQLESFGKGLKKYSAAVSGINVEAINISVNATKSLSKMASDLPNVGGVVSWFAGDNDMGTFGGQLASYGSSLKKYSNVVAGLDAGSIDASVKATKSISELASSLPNSGGIVSWFTGDNDIGKFGESLSEFGKSIKKYSEELSYIDVSKLIKITDSLEKMINIIKNLSIASIDWDSIKTNVVSEAINLLSDSIFEITNAINEGMEITPVVKPVLDLSNIRQGASLIPSMLNTQPALGTLSKVGYISSNMSRNSQNGNSDVVAAIDKLRESLGDIGNDTYNINGITYNDDSAIADAIKTIIRAINIERRS